MPKLLPLVALAVALVVADKKTDKEVIQGTWVFAALEIDGKEVKDLGLYDYLKDLKLTFKGDAVLRTTDGKSEEGKTTFTLGPDKKPATIDMVVKDSKGQVQGTEFGLYELRDDTLRLCFGPNLLAERAKEFTSKDGQVIITYKRDDKKPEK